MYSECYVKNYKQMKQSFPILTPVNGNLERKTDLLVCRIDVFEISLGTFLALENSAMEWLFSYMAGHKY